MPETSSINYEQVTYPNFVHAQTHPNCLAVMARAYGLKTAPVEKCRVLEIGCGSGTNLLAMATDLPESRFVGVDLSSSHINFGLQAAADLGLNNVELICADLMQVDFAGLGEFDYIIAHGFFSWIPPEVRERFLEMCGRHLAPKGVAFVSYNAFPGCHLRLMMREMMLYHTERVESPADKVSQSVSLLGFLKKSAFEREIYGRILEYEFERTIDRQGEIIIHDDLGTFNQPFYFHEFISEAERFDLKFLSEAEYFSDKYTGFDQEIVKVMNQFRDEEVVRREQYFDFLKNRRFRQTLLCHRNAQLTRRVTPDFFDDLRIVCDLNPESESPDLTPQAVEKFLKSGKEGASVDHPLTKAALYYMCEVFPRSVSFSELVEVAEKTVRKQLGEEFEFGKDDREILKDVLLKIYGSDLVNFFLYEPRIAHVAGEKPRADDFVRWQAQHSDTLFTKRHRTKKIEDDFVRLLLLLADGNHTRDQMARVFEAQIRDGGLSVEAEDESDKQKIIDDLPQAIELQLRQAAKLGLLIS